MVDKRARYHTRQLAKQRYNWGAISRCFVALVEETAQPLAHCRRIAGLAA
ncbi:MAG: hypothetical protein KDE45_13660 [Caldilineaceae bacterium]|nr:hypothetical protein [Caldilineaceae bacterium]